MNLINKTDCDMYDVINYTDVELYELLDLSNPTDRELEAKIIFLYRKYKNMQNSSGDQLAKFFQDIHNHFFENDSEPEEEEEDDEEEENSNIKEGMTTLLDAQKQQSFNVDASNKGNNKIVSDISTDNRTFLTDTQINIDSNKNKTATYSGGQSSSQKVNFIKQLDYSTDTTNPLLKETVTRVISIDSQYRADKNSLPTEFTFDLADSLKDVVSLSLYSVQIPYTWYTIAKSYGSNFFYIKGSSPGINNGNHDIQIAINPGNYDPNNLIIEINSSMVNTFKSYTDISFGESNINYNAGNSKSYIKIDITKQYNENSYELNFPYYTTPNIYENIGNLDDVARARNSIPAFLGLNQQSYKLNTLTSRILTTADYLTNNNMLYSIDQLSTTITVIKYTSIIDKTTSKASFYNPGVTPVDLSFNITLNLQLNGATKYSRNNILTDFSNQLFNSTYLSSESSIRLIEVTNIDDIRYDSTYGSYYFELELKPNRYTTNNTTNSKLFIQFPDETNIASTNTRIWTGTNINGLKSCFYFSNESNEMQLITSETPIVKQTNLYQILQGPYVILKCVNTNFISPANDISFNLKLNQSTNNTTYTISEMIDSINAGIIDQSFNKPFLDGLPNLSFDTLSNSILPSKTYVYEDADHNFSVAIDIAKSFGNNNYRIDFSGNENNGTFLNTFFFLGNNLTTFKPIIDSSLINIKSSFPVGLGGRVTIPNGSILFYVKPVQDMCGNELDDIGPIYYFDASENFSTYTTGQGLGNLSTKLTTYLQNYKYQGNYIFTSQTIFNITPALSSGEYNVSLDLYINRQITSYDYNIQFIDNVNPLYEANSNLNFWYDPLNIDSNVFIAKPFDLSNDSPFLTKYTNSTAITVKASRPIEVVTINFAYIPNTIKLIGYEDGVQTTLGTNDVEITIPIYDSTNNLIYYTRDMLLSTLNSLLAANPLSYGSYLYLTPPNIDHNYYLKIFTNINKIYTASDYKVVFYDAVSFVRCFTGAKGVQNTTWDSTLGWILGFRNSTYYILNEPSQLTTFDYYTSFLLSNSSGIFLPDSKNTITIVGDTGVSTNLFNYFMICLDDYNLNHLNDGLVTITGQDTSVSLPSYTDRSNFQCDPVTNQLTYNGNTREYYSQLTQKQLYSLAQKSNAKNTTASNILGGLSSSVYGRGPFSQDVFAVIPLKLNGLQNGQYIIEYGGTLQSNNRFYFGPVNIHRMTVKLISDKGNTVDLNGTNWSFSFICQQLYKQKK
jgi:hypothetical protein